jgi:hypothetical protein
VALIHFLLVYDLARQALVSEPRAFLDGRAAAEAYSALETLHRNDQNIQIVLVGADSLDTIKVTHANFFADKEKRSPYLEAVAPR